MKNFGLKTKGRSVAMRELMLAASTLFLEQSLLIHTWVMPLGDHKLACFPLTSARQQFLSTQVTESLFSSTLIFSLFSLQGTCKTYVDVCYNIKQTSRAGHLVQFLWRGSTHWSAESVTDSLMRLRSLIFRICYWPKGSRSRMEFVQNAPVDVFKTPSHNPRSQFVDLGFKCDAYRSSDLSISSTWTFYPTQTHIY